MVTQYVVSAGTLGSLILGFLRLRKGQREIHVLVNSKLDAALARAVQLTDTLSHEGIDIPTDPSDG